MKTKPDTTTYLMPSRKNAERLDEAITQLQADNECSTRAETIALLKLIKVSECSGEIGLSEMLDGPASKDPISSSCDR